MRESLIFSTTCPTLGRAVQLETRNWYVEIDGENEVIHYRAQCECGQEHFGSSTKLLTQRQPSEFVLTFQTLLRRCGNTQRASNCFLSLPTAAMCA